MTDEDDIARVARLRGRNPLNYTSERVSVETVAMKLGAESLRGIFVPPHDPGTEMLFYDALPKPSRMLIADSPVAISAVKFADLLEIAMDQAALISLVRQIIPLRLREIVVRRYGPKHPQAQEPA